MENNNGKGIFYGVIGVATLIVAIIGATFAYFSATTASTEYVQGAAATASLGVHVDRLTTYSAGEGVDSADAAKYVMVPQLDVGLSQAIRGSEVTSNVPCIDANGSLVCSIYKITVQNTGSAAIDVSGSITFYGTSTKDQEGVITDTDPGEKAPTAGNNLLNHLKWARLVDPANLYKGAAGDGKATFTEIDAVKTIPNTLYDYSTGLTTGIYQTLPDGTTHAHANYTNPNLYLYAMDVTADQDNAEEKDLLGTAPTTVWSHGKYTDLIDPTDDLNTQYATNGEADDGVWHLEALNQAGDTKVFYIVVWISENNEEQNDVDFGQFTGQVTFASAGGSGATSTFTEAYTGA